MDKLLWLLIFPIVWPFIAKAIWPKVIHWGEVAINIFGVVVLVSIVFFCGRLSMMHDTEVWNGQVTAKHRQHGSYIESYQCNCYESCSGSGNNRSCSQVCQTCFRDHYTVNWYLNSSLGDIRIQYLDWLSSSVYDEPNPPLYTRAFVGEACSEERSFDNYVRAVPNSLFGTVSELTQQRFLKDIPAYPEVYDIYHIHRVLNVKAKTNPTVLDSFNYQLNQSLTILGAQRQVNVIAIVTGIPDPNYRYAVENNWLGGKKNDVVIFIGTSDGNKIDWVDVMTWALNKGNGIFRSELKDNISAVGVIDPVKLTTAIHDTVQKDYTRPHMKDFEYLKKEIVPPGWVIWLCIFLSVVGSIGTSILFYRMETNRDYY